jgi:UDP-3-O-[3-hydroxymyristoyl] glucosamine N-acyltransferase
MARGRDISRLRGRQDVTEYSFFTRGADLSIAEIAALTGAEPREGVDLSRRVTDIAPIDQATATDLSFVSETKFAASLQSTRAGVVLTTENFARHAPEGVAVLCVRKPYDAFIAVARRIYSGALRPSSTFGTVGISPGAMVHPTAQLADGVTVDPFAVIGPSVRIGAGTLIGSHAVIGPGVRIGDDCAVGASCSVTHAHVGDRVIIHPGCDIGQDGYGYLMSNEGHTKIPQVGRVIIHDDVEIGSGTRIDRGGIRDTVIGEGTKIDNLCQIGHNCIIGRRCIIVAQSGLSGSVTLEDFVVLGPRTGIIPHITVGKGAITASRSTIYADVPAGEFWGGFPAKPRTKWLREVVALEQLAARSRKKSDNGPSET